MDYDRHVCPVLDVDGVIASGKQFDLDIRLPEDDRNVIYGVIKDCYGDPVRDAVVKLVEVVCECGKEERRPVSHTFTDKEGEFVFGPLCANKFYEIQIWVDEVKHCKICVDGKHEGKCLKGIKLDCKHHDFKCDKHDEKHEDKWDDKCEKKCDCKCDDKHEDKCEKKFDCKWEDKHEDKCEKEHDCKCDCKCEDKHDDKNDKKCEEKHEEKCERPCCMPCFKQCMRPCDR